MKISDRRLSAMIGKDPVAVSYVIDGTTYTTTGLLHRAGQERARGESEDEAGTTDRQNLRLMLRTAAGAAPLPPEGTVLTVGGVAYRSSINELSSDQSHYIVHLADENG